MLSNRVGRASTAILLAGAAVAFMGAAGAAGRAPAELLGTWRGTSVCTDRVAAPACRDEVIVYEFSRGRDEGTVHWKADKIVAGQREPMGELDLAWDTAQGCWLAEHSNPRVKVFWCLKPDGAQLTGLAWLMPGKRLVRKVEARKE